jgi:hypothetical protein
MEMEIIKGVISQRILVPIQIILFLMKLPARLLGWDAPVGKNYILFRMDSVTRLSVVK